MARPLTTPQLLRHLRKQEENWRSNRWGYLLLSLIPIVGNLYAVWKFDTLVRLLGSVFGERSLEAGLYPALGASVALILAGFGALGLAHVIKNWRGNRMRQLLIVLADREPEPKKFPVGARPKQF
jgi:hypothetical protein